MVVVFIIFIGITIYFVYYNWSLIKNNVYSIKFGTHKEKENGECNSIECNSIERTYKWEKQNK